MPTCRRFLPGAAIALAFMAGGITSAAAGPVCADGPACADPANDPQPLINDAAPGMLDSGAAPAGALPRPAMHATPAAPAMAAPPPPPADEPAAEPAPAPADPDKPGEPPPQ